MKKGFHKKSWLLMKPREEKYRKALICLNEIGCFLKILEDKLYLRGIHSHSSLKSINLANNLLKNIDNKCFMKLIRCFSFILKSISMCLKTES